MSWTQIHNHSTVPVPHEPSWARVILLSLLQVLSTLHRSVFFEIIPVSHYASSFFKRFLKKIIRVLTFQVLKLVLTTCTRSHPSLRSIFTSSHPAVILYPPSGGQSHLFEISRMYCRDDFADNRNHI